MIQANYHGDGGFGASRGFDYGFGVYGGDGGYGFGYGNGFDGCGFGVYGDGYLREVGDIVAGQELSIWSTVQ